MKRVLLAALALLLLAAIPAQGSHEGRITEATVRADLDAVAPGITVKIIEIEVPGFNAFYVPPGEMLCLGPAIFGVCFGEVYTTTEDTVFFLVGTTLDADAAQVVARHEAAHALQYRAGREFDEWEADLLATDSLCAEGQDGLSRTLRVLGMLLPSSQYAILGSKHGHPYERMENLKRNSRCRAAGVQAP